MTDAATRTVLGSDRIVLRSAHVYAPRFPYSTSLIVSDGRISWIGDDTGLTGQLLPSDQIVDCEQRLITPGFFDAFRSSTWQPGPALCGFISDTGALWQRTTHDEGQTCQLPASLTEQPFAVLPGGDPDGRAASLLRDGVPIAFGSFVPGSSNQAGSNEAGSHQTGSDNPWEWIRASVFRDVGGISARAGFNAVTRAGWRLAGLPELGSLVPGQAAHLNIWECEGLEVQAPDDRVARWSTDERAGTSPLPDLRPDQSLPHLWASIHQQSLVHLPRFQGSQ